jgi:manganese efflux pump family protein
MDAFSVSISSGMSFPNLKKRGALRMAASFGGFQMAMPALGWLGGLTFQKLIAHYDHWIAFILLAAIGGKMIYEATRSTEEKTLDPTRLTVLLVLSIATSIDALAVGLSFSCLCISITTPILVIGAVTFALSLAGVFLGRTFGHFFHKRIEIVGGLILIGIGIKILTEHLLAATSAIGV